jgi:hypothetical protein
MTSGDLLPAAVLRLKAVVDVRQSIQQQVQLNTESTRRQYELVEVNRRHNVTSPLRRRGRPHKGI